ncbi:unnamed protein product [Zymoseptoria tritici ST99CH_1E4]|uniref:Peptidase M14 carboxypeptidase A domain-containing protein n=1 Tax=Zymoseptoria tritici ST99CH_1E4 TaxID=1276532 RepID=A0A2H1H9H1_ZYMTR|nr:unnamed protein product [Zymoseptoria tritici ST99CH_1E4]
MALLGKLDAYQTWTASLLSKMDILVLPRYNVDGVHYFQRTLANNLDGNREAVKFDRQQSRTIRQRFIDYSPHIAVDLHEFTAPTIYGGDFQHAADALIFGGRSSLPFDVQQRGFCQILYYQTMDLFKANDTCHALNAYTSTASTHVSTAPKQITTPARFFYSRNHCRLRTSTRPHRPPLLSTSQSNTPPILHRPEAPRSRNCSAPPRPTSETIFGADAAVGGALSVQHGGTGRKPNRAYRSLENTLPGAHIDFKPGRDLLSPGALSEIRHSSRLGSKDGGGFMVVDTVMRRLPPGTSDIATGRQILNRLAVGKRRVCLTYARSTAGVSLTITQRHYGLMHDTRSGPRPNSPPDASSANLN